MQTRPNVVQLPSEQERVIPLDEAARHLGISTEAIRMRIRRHRIRGVQIDRRWYIPTSELDSQPNKTEQDHTTRSDKGVQELIAHLESEVQFLREECSRKDSIIFQFSQNIPKLMAPESEHRQPRRWFWRRAI